MNPIVLLALAGGAYLLFKQPATASTPGPGTPPPPGPVPPPPPPPPTPAGPPEPTCLELMAVAKAAIAASGEGSDWERAVLWAEEKGNTVLQYCLQTEPGSDYCQTMFAEALLAQWSGQTQQEASDFAGRLDEAGKHEQAACIRQLWEIPS